MARKDDFELPMDDKPLQACHDAVSDGGEGYNITPATKSRHDLLA